MLNKPEIHKNTPATKMPPHTPVKPVVHIPDNPPVHPPTPEPHHVAPMHPVVHPPVQLQEREPARGLITKPAASVNPVEVTGSEPPHLIDGKRELAATLGIPVVELSDRDKMALPPNPEEEARSRRGIA